MNKKLSKKFEGTLFESQDQFYDVDEKDLIAALNNYVYSDDAISAKNLLLYINWCFGKGESPNKTILEGFISHGFKKVVEKGLTLDQAFCFSKARGQYARPEHLDRDIEATIRIILLMREGTKYLDAIEDACAILCPDGNGDRTIKDAYDFYKNYYDVFSSEELNQQLDQLILERS